MNIIFEDNFGINTNDTEIDYKRTSSMFHGLDGDIAYPFTIAVTPPIANKLGFPNLINVARKTADTFPVRFKHGNFQIAKGNFKVRTGNIKTLSADFTTTPGGIPKNIWNKKLNEFNLGNETIPTQNINNTFYEIDINEVNGTLQYFILDNSTEPSNLSFAIQTTFLLSNVRFVLGSREILNEDIKPGKVVPAALLFDYFQEVLDKFNQFSGNVNKNEFSFNQKQLIGIFDGIKTEALTIIIDHHSAGDKSDPIQRRFTFVIQPKIAKQITNYYNDSLKSTWTKPYQFPQINNAKLYSSTSNFNGIINKTVNGDILRNSISEKNKYSHVPMFYLTWILKKIFLTQGYTAQGSFFQNPDIKKILIFNITTTDKLIDGINYPINIHNNILTYSNHLPAETLGDYISMLIEELGITIAFNEVTKIVDISFFDDFLQKTDFEDLTKFASSEPTTDFIEKKKTQLTWQLSGDSLAKEDLDPYQSMPTKAIVQASNDEYETITLKIPGLNKDSNNLPILEAAGKSPLFTQTQNTSPLRFIFWEDNTGKVESSGLSLNLQSPKSIFIKFLKNKNLFEYNSETIRAYALMPLNKILSFDYRKPIKIYGIFMFIDTINLKLKGSKHWYQVELILKKFLY